MERGNSVELIGHYGGDELHALAAWTSTSRDLTLEKQARIPNLLKMLAEAGHHTPFERSMLHFSVKCETASHIHLIKHRIGVSINGESARYKELLGDHYYLPEDWPEAERKLLAQHCEVSLENYHAIMRRLEQTHGRKRAKESSRFYLPYANQIELDVSFNFRSFMHFQGLRNSAHAQLEIRRIAQKMLQSVKDVGAFEHSLKAFKYA